MSGCGYSRSMKVYTAFQCSMQSLLDRHARHRDGVKFCGGAPFGICAYSNALRRSAALLGESRPGAISNTVFAPMSPR